MGVEIERKFTVRHLPEDLDKYPYHVIEQGYLNVSPAIRVRREDDSCYMTYKNRSTYAESIQDTKSQVNSEILASNKQQEQTEQTVLEVAQHDVPIGSTEYNLPLDKDSYEHMLAKADGNVATEEINALREVSIQLGLSEAELNSMLNLGSTTLKDAYAVLEISESATDEEVRQAYKRMVIKHHPDRVASLGEDVKAAAEKKMREINEAKELIYKARGL